MLEKAECTLWLCFFIPSCFGLHLRFESLLSCCTSVLLDLNIFQEGTHSERGAVEGGESEFVCVLEGVFSFTLTLYAAI